MPNQNVEKSQQKAADDKVVKGKYVVRFNRKECIGVFSCTAVLPEAWKVAADGKADLSGSREIEPDTFELEITREELTKMLESAEVCPVNAIHITEKDTGRKII